jgi:transcriptional regulator with XRE-family HTH domain
MNLDHLKVIRLSKNISIEQLSKMSGVKKSTIEKLESGEYGKIRVKTLLKILIFLGYKLTVKNR